MEVDLHVKVRFDRFRELLINRNLNIANKHLKLMLLIWVVLHITSLMVFEAIKQHTNCL